MTVESSEFYSILLVSIIAFIIPFITKRLGIPVIVGEIGLGILVGVVNRLVYHFTGIHLIQFTEGGGLEFLAEIGLIFLLFLAGLEIDINILEEKGKVSILFGLIMFMIAFGLCLTFMWVLGMGVYMALILSTTSVGVVIPILREMGISKTHLGQDIILSAVVADFATMMLIPVMLLVETDPMAHWTTYATLFVIIVVIFTVFFGFFIVGGIAMWKWPKDMAKFFKSDDPSEMGVRASFLILFAFVALTVTFGMDIVLGAFLAGAAINFIFREGAILERKLFGFGYGFLIPLFFIEMGVEFTEIVEPEGLLIVPALVVIAFIVKIVPSTMFLKEHKFRNTMASGVLLSARLSLLIAAINIGIAHGIADVEENAAGLIILALIMCVAAPIGFRYLYMPPEEDKPPEEVEAIHELITPEEEG